MTPTIRRDENDEQVVVGIDGDGVDVAIALEKDADPEAVLELVGDATTEVSRVVSESERERSGVFRRVIEP